MSNLDDRWLWFIDDAPLQALLKAEGELGTMRMRAASSPGVVRAMTAHMEGRTPEAAVALKELIESGERQPEAFLLLGQIHFEAGQYEQAEAVYQSLLQLDASHSTAAFNAAVCQERLSRWGDAAALFRRAADLDAQRRDAWLGLGLCCLHQRCAGDALAAFETYLANEPDNEPAQFGRAVALQMLRRSEEAAAIYDRFRSVGEPSSELLTNLLALAVARKDASGLEALAVELEQIRPGLRQTVEAQAYSSFVAGRWEEAAARLAQLATGDPLPEDWAYAHCYALWRCGQQQDAPAQAALRQTDALLRQRPNHPAALLLRGVLLEEAGRADDAMDSYRKAAAQAPDSDAALWNLARLAAASGKADICEEVSKSLLDRNRQSAEGWFAAGLGAAVDHRIPDAIRAFSESLRLRRDWPEAEWNLGLCQLEAGDAAQALRSLEKGYEPLAGQVPAEPLARAAVEAGSLDRACQILESAGELGTAPELLFNIALAYHDGGQLDRAESLYRLVIDGEPPFADAHINLGHLLLAAGRPGDAEALWTAAAEWEAAGGEGLFPCAVGTN